MATSSSETSVPEGEYAEKKSKVVEQIRNKSVKPEDLYILATLLTIYASNDSLPLCLLCQKNEAKKPFQLGHLIPHSILKTSGLNYFADVNQGKESGPSNMGYRAFCAECEGRFSKNGEVYLNKLFFKPFYEKQDEAITFNVRDNGRPWLYFSILSIVWRCLCFVPDSSARDSTSFHNTLEYLRSFILDYPNQTNQSDIDSKVTLYVFAPNCELENKLNDDNETYKRLFYGMYTGVVLGPINQDVIVWVFLGPIHILMKYGNVANELDLGEKAQACVIRSTTSEFTIPKKNDRFFPMAMYDWIISLGRDILSKTVRIRPSHTSEIPTLPPVKATNLFLLPKSVMYSNGDFCIPKFYEIKFQFSIKICNDSIKIVGALQGKDKVLFVAFDNAIEYIEDGNTKNGPLAMALKVDINGNNINVSYQKDVYIPSKEKCGQDLNQHIPKKETIEKLISSWILKEKVKW